MAVRAKSPGREREVASPGISTPTEQRRGISQALLEWYDRDARDLPWRRTGDPYAIWLSEIMLQQTRVETVIPYYERFVARYPRVTDLAAASLDEVLQAWSGLGYYRRARMLWKAAGEVTERHAGRFPDDVAGLNALSGVGRYTAGAIASIAFGRQVPLVDGNVARVLSRMFVVRSNVQKGPGNDEIWRLAEELVPAERPGCFNQSLMELGARICVPRTPSCGTCPIRRYCGAHAQGLVEQLPLKVTRPSSPVVEFASLVMITPDDRVLMGRRTEGGLFGGLWEPLLISLSKKAEPLGSCRKRLAAAGLSLAGARFRHRGDLVHILTHRRFEVAVYLARVSNEWAEDHAAPDGLSLDHHRYTTVGFHPLSRVQTGSSTLSRRIIEIAKLESNASLR